MGSASSSRSDSSKARSAEQAGAQPGDAPGRGPQQGARGSGASGDSDSGEGGGGGGDGSDGEGAQGVAMREAMGSFGVRLEHMTHRGLTAHLASPRPPLLLLWRPPARAAALWWWGAPIMRAVLGLASRLTNHLMVDTLGAAGDEGGARRGRAGRSGWDRAWWACSVGRGAWGGRRM